MLWRNLLFISLLCLPSGAAVLVLHPDPNTWQLDTADKILVNGKPKLRLGNAGETQVRPDEYKKLSSEPAGETPIRMQAGGYFAYRTAAGWAPVAPDGANLKTSVTYASLWSSARVDRQKGKSKGNEVNATEVFAILAGDDASDAVADFVLDEGNFTGFDERMSMLIGIAGVVSEGAAGKLKALLLAAMEKPTRQANTGITQSAEIDDGLRYAQVSEKAFPGDPAQKQARDQLRERKAWLDRRTAILSALAAGEQWDAFIDKYADFERFDGSFDDLRKLRERSFRESGFQHLSEGKRLEELQQYTPALREIRIALSRNRDDKQAQELLEDVRLKEARSHASLVRQKPVDTKSSQYTRLNRNLAFAERYVKEGRLKDAESEIASAELLDKDAPRILLVKAELHQARKEFMKAIELLDDYDRRVIADEQIAAGEAIRNPLLIEMRSTKEKLSAEIAKAESEGDYAEALKLARSGVQVSPEDPEFLYHAGFDSAVMRNEKDASDFLKRYLVASQSLIGDRKLRAEVMGVLPILSTRTQSVKGKPNWFSGYNSPDGLFYCPVSLMPNPHPADIKASKKQTASFAWNRGQLASVETVSTQPGDNSSKIYFDSFPDGKGVRRVGTEEFKDKTEPPIPKLTPDGPVGAGHGTYVVTLNHPVINPYMVERLTGKRVATIVAGNPYFHPFVWTKIHTFIAEYDSAGRVRSAKEIQAENGTGKTLDFEWQGNHLLAVIERGPKPGTQGEYRRDIHYSGDRITGETVHFQGRNSKIEYKYEGGRLAEAICDSDPSIDGRSRKVSFQ